MYHRPAHATLGDPSWQFRQVTDPINLAARTYTTGMRTIGRPGYSRYSASDMGTRGLLSVVLVISGFGADIMTAPQLIKLARSKPEALANAITATFDSKELKT